MRNTGLRNPGRSARRRRLGHVRRQRDERSRCGDRQAQGRPNDYTVPAHAPAGGLQVIFSADGVMIGDTYFGLTTTGLARFRSVRVLPEHPPAIELETVLTWGSNFRGPRIHVSYGALRVPVSATAAHEAKKVLAHYSDVVARNVIVRPNFWRWRIRIGLTTAMVCALVAAAGFGAKRVGVDLGDVGQITAAIATLVGLGGLILAFAAWRFHHQQHRRAPTR